MPDLSIMRLRWLRDKLWKEKDPINKEIFEQIEQELCELKKKVEKLSEDDPTDSFIRK